MSAGEMQSFIARLYVDAPFRRLFHLEPTSLLGEYGLDEAEAAALRGLDGAMLDYFAASLENKRRKRVEHAYPLLFKMDRRALERVFHRFHQIYRARPRQQVSQDAIDFGFFSEETLGDAPGLPAFASDLARYERLLFEANLPHAADTGGEAPPLAPTARPRRRGRVAVARFDHDMAAIDDALRLESAAGPTALDEHPPVPAPCHLVFLPNHDGTGAGLLRVNDMTHALIDRCEGLRTVAEVVDDFQRASQDAAAPRAILAALEQLVRKGVLTCTPPSVEPVRQPLNWQHSEVL